jgi:hypothetical protein
MDIVYVHCIEDAELDDDAVDDAAADDDVDVNEGTGLATFELSATNAAYSWPLAEQYSSKLKNTHTHLQSE